MVRMMVVFQSRSTSVIFHSEGDHGLRLRLDQYSIFEVFLGSCEN